VAALALCVAVLGARALPAVAGDVTVSVNGTVLVFDQPPVERDGRVFVPLRGIFERLGASVVDDRGAINATAGAHTISLRVGSNDATVDGAPRVLDSPPFVAAGRVLVPLRFIAQALGASVTFDPNAHSVAIVGTVASPGPTSAGAGGLPSAVGSAPSNAPPAPPSAGPSLSAPLPPGTVALRLLRVEPEIGTTLARKRPELSLTFGEPVDASSVRLTVDGRAVEPLLSTARSVVASPTFDLAAGTHVAVVTGSTSAHEPFSARWSFATSDAPNANFLSGLEPPNGLVLPGDSLEVGGFTRPGSAVRIVATTNDVTPTFAAGADGTVVTDTVADATGAFDVRVALEPGGAGGIIDVRIASTAPNGDVAIRTLRLRR
jgi:hypothetical protein